MLNTPFDALDNQSITCTILQRVRYHFRDQNPQNMTLYSLYPIYELANFETTPLEYLPPEIDLP